MRTSDYWTGIVDVSSTELPNGAKGAVYRVLTFAEDYDSFLTKVTTVLAASGDTVAFIEEAETLTDFLQHHRLDKSHEIHEMMQTAEKSNVDVVCGDIEYYSFDDA